MKPTQGGAKLSDSIENLLSGGSKPLPLANLTSRIYRFLADNFWALAKLAFLPFVIALVAAYSDIYLGRDADLGRFLVNLASLAAFLVFAVAVHRGYLLKNEFRLNLGRRELNYVLRSVLLVLPLLAITFTTWFFAFAAFGDANMLHQRLLLVSIPLWMFCAWLFLRMSLILPACSIQYDGNLKSHLKMSWNKMKGQVGASVGCYVVYVLVFGIVFYIPRLLIRGTAKNPDTAPYASLSSPFLETLSFYFIYGTLVVMLSVLFEHHVLRSGEDEAGDSGAGAAHISSA